MVGCQKEQPSSVPQATNPFVASLFPSAAPGAVTPFSAFTGATQRTTLFGDRGPGNVGGGFGPALNATAQPSPVPLADCVDIPVPDDDDEVRFDIQDLKEIVSAGAETTDPARTSDLASEAARTRLLHIRLEERDGNGGRVLGAVDICDGEKSSTLADVRTMIAADAIEGIPQRYRFIFQGAPVSRRQETRRNASACLPRLTLVPQGEAYDISDTTDIENEYQNWDLVSIKQSGASLETESDMLQYQDELQDASC